jgi:hypothetical protein
MGRQECLCTLLKVRLISFLFKYLNPVGALYVGISRSAIHGISFRSANLFFCNYKFFRKASISSQIMRFPVTIATVFRALTGCINVSFVKEYGEESSLLLQSRVSVLWLSINFIWVIRTMVIYSLRTWLGVWLFGSFLEVVFHFRKKHARNIYENHLRK